MHLVNLVEREGIRAKDELLHVSLCGFGLMRELSVSCPNVCLQGLVSVWGKGLDRWGDISGVVCVYVCVHAGMCLTYAFSFYSFL